MRIIPPAAIPVRLTHLLGIHNDVAGLLLNTDGNGSFRSPYQPAGGVFGISANTLADSKAYIYFSFTAGQQPPNGLWANPMSLAFRHIALGLNSEGAYTMGFGVFQFGGSADTTAPRTSVAIANKRIVLHIERAPAGGITAYFVMLGDGGILQAGIVPMPDALDRVTILWLPGKEASLWYADEAIARYTTNFPTGAYSEAGVLSVAAYRIHRKATGAGTNNAHLLGNTLSTPDP